MIDLSLFEPITWDNINELKPGDWIWDNKPIDRREHKRSLNSDTVTEPIGFRLIHIIDLEQPIYSKPFMLSDLDSRNSGYVWTYFELNRFYKFKGEAK